MHAHVHHFVDPKYYPKGFTFEDPRNIRKETILNFCRHVKARQDSFGISDGFRFLRYQDGKERILADYGTRADEERAVNRATNKRSARNAVASQGNTRPTAKSKGKQRDPGPEVPSGSENQQGLRGPDPDTNFPDPATDLPDPETSLPNPNNVPHRREYPHVIDPALIDEENQSRAGPSTEAQDDSEHILITGMEMQVLKGLGHPAIIPVNGPGDGLPMYSVPRTFREILDRQARPESDDHENVPDGDALVTEKKPANKRKRGRNADMRTVEEGKALLKKDGRSRSGKKLRRR